MFSRLSRGTKGDHRSLLVAWRDVIAAMPECVLILAGANVDARFTMYAPVPKSMQLANPLNLDPQYNIELAQSVACDYAEIVRTCVTLAGSEPSRRRPGAAARERATSQLSIEAATARAT